MKKLLTGVSAIAIFIASAGPAMADPVTIIATTVNALVSAAGIGTTVATVGATVITIGQVVAAAVVVGGSFLLSSLTGGGRQGGGIDPARAKETFEAAESSELRAIGRVRIGGLKAFGNTNGVNRFRLILHCKGPVDAVEAHYLGGREVTVESNGSVSSPPYARPGGSYINISSKPGNGSETSWGQLQSIFPALWGASHRVRGIAQTLVQYESPGVSEPKFLKLYQGGAPDYERVQRGELIFDPRTNTTAWSDNGVLCALHMMLTFPNFELVDFDLVQIAAEANKADVLVSNRSGGTEKRCRAWGVWPSENPRGDTLGQLLLSIGAEVAPTTDEKLGIFLLDDARTAEIDIPERHIIDLKWRSGPENVERPNICRIKYYSPERNYELAEIDLTGIAWARIDAEIERVGEQIAEYTLPFCPSAAQAQRIARRLFALARADQGVVTTNLYGLSVWGARAISIEFPDLGIAPVCSINPPRVNDGEGTVEIPFSVWPELAAWNPSVDEALPPPVVPDLSYTSTVPTPAAPTAATVVTYPSGGGLASRVAFVSPSGTQIAEASYRTYTAGNPNSWQSMNEVISDGGFEHAYTGADLTGLLCDFRVRAFNADEDGSYWSAIFQTTMAVNNTAPAAPSIVATNLLGEVTIRVTVPNNLNVSYLTLTGNDAPGNVAVKPGDIVEWETTLIAGDPSPSDYVFSATAKSTNGTASATVSQTISY